MKKLIGIVMSVVVSTALMAVPARQTGWVRTATDGTQKTVYLHGDETFHYLTDDAGTWLDEQTLLPLSEEVKGERMKMRAESRRIAQLKQVGTERLLAPRGAIILVSFQDKAFESTNAQMTDWAMGANYTENGGTGSIHNYFYDQSWGKYDLQIDVYGPVTVSQNYAYYGQDSGGEGKDIRPDEMVVEACKLADSQCGADFSQYDYNNDGDVDWVVIVYAGLGQNDGGDANTIWPHQNDLSYKGKTFKLDGKRVNHYCCLNEIDGITNIRSGIGVFCHEFSHIMGLPDLYTTDYSSHKTLGQWDIMDYGAYNNNVNTPPSYSAYERWWMGWFQPTLLNSAKSVELGDLNEQNACYLTENGDTVNNILSPYPTVFYLLENRQGSGWDAYQPGHGMLITRINYRRNWWVGNTVNNSASNMGVDILEADGLAPSADDGFGYLGKQGDTYPSGADTFTKVTSYQVTNIQEVNKLIRFDVNGGDTPTGMETPGEQRTESKKIIRNGQILILRGNKTYTILGNENHQL